MNDLNVNPEAPASKGVSCPPGFRRLELGEIIEKTDRAMVKGAMMKYFDDCSAMTNNVGLAVRAWDGNYYYRPIPKGVAPPIELGNEVEGSAPNTGAAIEAAYRAGYCTGYNAGQEPAASYSENEGWEAERAALTQGGATPMWMADSRPLLAEIARLAEEVTALRAANEGFRASLVAQAREVNRLEAALGYLAHKENYDIHEEGYDLKRPGGGGQTGIIVFSRHLAAWTFSREVLGIDAAALTQGGDT